MGFEPAFAASEWPQTHALDRSVIGIGAEKCTGCKLYIAMTVSESCPVFSEGKERSFTNLERSNSEQEI
jgi:hypothetical protein